MKRVIYNFYVYAYVGQNLKYMSFNFEIKIIIHDFVRFRTDTDSEPRRVDLRLSDRDHIDNMDYYYHGFSKCLRFLIFIRNADRLLDLISLILSGQNYRPSLGFKLPPQAHYASLVRGLDGINILTSILQSGRFTFLHLQFPLLSHGGNG